MRGPKLYLRWKPDGSHTARWSRPEVWIRSITNRRLRHSAPRPRHGATASAHRGAAVPAAKTQAARTTNTLWVVLYRLDLESSGNDKIRTSLGNHAGGVCD